MTTLKTAARETNAVLGVFVVVVVVFLFVCFILFCFVFLLLCFIFFLIPISRKPMLRYETYTRWHCSVR